MFTLMIRITLDQKDFPDFRQYLATMNTEWCRNTFHSFQYVITDNYDSDAYKYYLSDIVEIMELKAIVFNPYQGSYRLYKDTEDITKEFENWIEDNNIILNTNEGKMRLKLVWA